MSYFEAATAGHDLTPYMKRRASRFLRDAESARIVCDDRGYWVEDCLPLAVVIKYESEISWTVDMNAAVRDTQYALSKKN